MKRIVITLVIALTGVIAAFALNRQDRFPHERHARLFPLCTGCHEGVPAGERSRMFPSQALCAGCHNGTDVRRVSWSGPQLEISNLKFSHPAHNEIAELDCSDCHTREDAGRMAVRRAVPERCFGCHEATDHYTDAPCAQCHVPLANTAVTVAWIEQLPVPPSHQEDNFLERLHGELARNNQQACVVCHTRERCAACHVDAATRTEVLAIPAAQPQRALPPMTARYFVPVSHTQPDWIDKHGRAARDPASCSACHARESCTTCHATKAPDEVRALPVRSAGAAVGVRTVRKAPLSHNAPFFEQQHGSIAASQGETCTSCHTRTECEDCHSGSTAGTSPVGSRGPGNARTTRPDFHPANFLQRHASAAYGRNLECSNCHETSRFCRDCHEQTGMGTTGRIQAGFHDAQPFWLLNHGKPARQTLESCASCHKQTDCMQCHSGLGAFRISPHGPGFDPKRVQNRNARLCFACHLDDPLNRTSP